MKCCHMNAFEIYTRSRRGETVEVGCKGFPARSITAMLKDIGYTGRERKDLVRRIVDVAEEASRAIWRWSYVKE